MKPWQIRVLLAVAGLWIAYFAGISCYRDHQMRKETTCFRKKQLVEIGMYGLAMSNCHKGYCAWGFEFDEQTGMWRWPEGKWAYSFKEK
jgi:hypothetical protein